jgi:BirA family biotin operon repressor/biotin-[acetyl-CoA-carboxylase] ligase
MNSYTPLDIDRIEAARVNHCIGGKIVLFQSTGSTNDIAWEYATNVDNNGLCVLAESQHKGRGRRGRKWFSEPGQSILCSVLLTNTNIEAELLTLIAGIAGAEAINGIVQHNHGQAQLDRATQLQCRIKWPNDILIRNQKVAGILVEKRITNSTVSFVIGIGINCNQDQETFEQYKLNMPATSLAIETGQNIDRTDLVCVLLGRLEYWLDITNDGIIERWLQLSGMLGRHVTVECDGRKYSGFCRGVDPIDGLILHLDNSLVHLFAAAQTSVIEY